MPPQKGKEYQSVRAVFGLSCKHSVTFAKPWPKLGDEHFCFKCQEVAVIETAPKRVSGQVS